ncbi:TIGR03013 family XrtA/PEP-CTERM system glycosyltransferase [Rhodovibrio sodomensis]|uniref:TIGR03013 family XrtA/PEP-CTERM system glycosyltransferase n=1 Tax=Rhodovibrio sodomensis TaxID=1088 RepID=UPI001A924BC7|nr:TIGR03013 family XrtA/PEP-CTERM system glycosyltransferase [Rhodovibrio sodomensis]
MILLAAVELLLLIAAFGASTLLFNDWQGIADPFSAIGQRSVAIAVLVVLMLYAMGLYAWHVAKSYLDLLVRILLALALAFALYVLFAYAFGVLTLPFSAIAPGLSVSFIALALVHDAFLRIADLAHLKTHVLVLGTGTNAKRLEALENRGRASRYRIAAFIDIEDGENAVLPERIVASPGDLVDYVRRMGVDEIVLAPQDRRGSLPLESLVAVRLSGVPVTPYASFCERAEGAVPLEELKPSWFFEGTGFRTGSWHMAGKRVIDVTASLTLLALTFPILALTAFAIKLESPGPVFYTQRRVGQLDRPFTLYKFRSMRNDAERAGQVQWASQNDARVTRVGRIIRKSRIDEIPQALNVLKGEMSFVGPRPERPEFVELLAKEIPFYRERHCVKPGITGWAQLNYPYGASVEDARRKLAYDLFYIKHFTLMFDLSVALQTVRVVIWNAGAR